MIVKNVDVSCLAVPGRALLQGRVLFSWIETALNPWSQSRTSSADSTCPGTVQNSMVMVDQERSPADVEFYVF